eukprot:1755241-Rhodomonas_salina.1
MDLEGGLCVQARRDRDLNPPLHVRCDPFHVRKEQNAPLHYPPHDPRSGLASCAKKSVIDNGKGGRVRTGVQP